LGANALGGKGLRGEALGSEELGGGGGERERGGVSSVEEVRDRLQEEDVVQLEVEMEDALGMAEG